MLAAETVKKLIQVNRMQSLARAGATPLQATAAR
jgi:hypothetical protein